MSATMAVVKRNCLGIISLLLALIAVLFYPLHFGLFALVFGIGSLLHKENKTQVAAAIICSILLPGITMGYVSFLGLIGGLLWGD